MAGNKLTKSQVFKKLSEVQARASLRAQVKLDNCDRTKVIMACSTGKTYVGSDVIFKLKSKVNVVTVPSLQLVQQWIDRFRNDRRLKGYSILPVCSKIGIESPEDYGIENATTDRVAILDVCKKHQPVIIIVTYQSYTEFAAAVNGKVPVGFLVADEAHRTAGIRNKFFASCLDDKVLKITKRLFMTATPIVYRGDSKTVYCMNDRDSYGDVAFNYPYSQARDAGVVAPMRVHIFGVPTGESADTLNSMLEHKQQAMLAETLAKLKLRPKQRTRMLVYHNGIQSSKAFCEKLRSMGIWAEHLNGRDSVKKRLEVIDRFSNHKGPSVICSVRVFSEGVDAPEIDTIVFAERKSSPVDINQNTGRGTRWTERKNYLTVLLPYYTEFAMTQKEMRDSLMESKYGPLMEVMAAISSIDDAMAEYRIVPPEDVDYIAASSVISESRDAVQPVVSVVKDAPVIADDSDVSKSDVAREDVPLVNSLTLVKRLPVEVSVVTDSGEFEISDVRERYISEVVLDWPIDFDEICKVVAERFGASRPSVDHPLYRRLKDICGLKVRPYGMKQVLDRVYGKIRNCVVGKDESFKETVISDIEHAIESFGNSHGYFPTRKTTGDPGVEQLTSWGDVNSFLCSTKHRSLRLLCCRISYGSLSSAVVSYKNTTGHFPYPYSSDHTLLHGLPKWINVNSYLAKHTEYSGLRGYLEDVFSCECPIRSRSSGNAQNKRRIVACDVCSSDVFVRGPSAKNGIFCSSECRNKSKLRACNNCGSKYTPRHRSSRQKFCSVDCSNQFNNPSRLMKFKQSQKANRNE